MYIIDRHIPDEILKKIQDFFTGHPQVAAVYLFGSYGTDFQLSSSDIDIGVVYCHSPELKEELELDDELSYYLKSDKIDLINLKKASLNLQYRVLREGELLVENEYVESSNFIEKVLKYYPDYRISQRQFMCDYEAALKEAYGSG